MGKADQRRAVWKRRRAFRRWRGWRLKAERRTWRRLLAMGGATVVGDTMRVTLPADPGCAFPVGTLITMSGRVVAHYESVRVYSAAFR
jgi:hypothetical protein